MSKKLKEDNINLRSEDVQEILTNPPIWIVRWGITLILFFTIILLLLSFLIRYPDFVSAKVLVTTKQPTEKIIALQTGQLEVLFISNRDTVRKGQKLAVIKSSADYADVYRLKEYFDSISSVIDQPNIPFDSFKKLNLGEIAPSLTTFEKSYTDLQLLRNLDPYYSKTLKEKLSLNEIKQRLKSQIRQKELLEKEFGIKKSDFERHKELLKKGVISQQQYEQKEIEFIQIQKNINSMSITISQMREAIVSANQTLKNTIISETEDETKFVKNVIQSHTLLVDAIRNWEYKYVLKSSIDGIISFQNYWGQYQHVKMGDVIFSVLPKETENLVGQLVIPAQNAGKVKIGQKVFVKLDNYPYQQYGMLLGKVSNFSISPNAEGNYIVYVSLPNGTKTSYNKKFKFTQELLGNAEIVTENISVAGRIFYKFKETLKYN